MANIGYDDTPILPGGQWRVHDGTRPQPRIVTPGCCYGKPPSDATVLFDGTSLDGWESLDGSAAQWALADGHMEVVPRTGNIRTKAHFGDCQLHLEFACPAEVKGDSQGRGNSGVFLLGLYEIQVLDCFNNPTYPDGTTAGIYGQYPPLVNASRPPGEWQTYDILWEGPRWDGDKLVKRAYVTVMWNGAAVHHRTETQGPTGHRTLSRYDQHRHEGPLMLQDHGDLVRFRNIWYRELLPYDA